MNDFLFHEIKPWKRKNYVIVFPSGNKLKVKGLQASCKKLKLNVRSMYGLSTGKIKYYKGFKCYKDPFDG